MIVHLLMALAGAAPTAPPVQRLSDAEVARVLEQAAARREAADAAAPPLKREIHGEVGVAVGSDGYRAGFGSALVPLGGESSALIQFSSETSRPNSRRRRR